MVLGPCCGRVALIVALTVLMCLYGSSKESTSDLRSKLADQSALQNKLSLREFVDGIKIEPTPEKYEVYRRQFTRMLDKEFSSMRQVRIVFLQSEEALTPISTGP